MRGSSSGPNYDADSVAQAMEAVRAQMPADSAAAHGLIIDCSHGNSGKDDVRQAHVVREIAGRVAQGEPGITGIMMESFLEGGNQPAAPLNQLVYGKSITDKCLSWPVTEQLLHELAEAPLVLQAVGTEPDDLRREGTESAQRRDDAFADGGRVAGTVARERDLAGDAAGEQQGDDDGDDDGVAAFHATTPSRSLSAAICPPSPITVSESPAKNENSGPT